MSAIYFHTEKEATATVRGTERAWMGLVCTNVAAALIPQASDRVRPKLTTAAVACGLDLVNRLTLRAYLNSGDDPVFQLGGEPLANFALVLNTVPVIGGPPLCLMARLHAQCEIHAYVEGPNRAWLADVIEDGLGTGLFRPSITVDGIHHDRGWCGVVDLLRARDDQPVVTSYSVCDGFPNPAAARWVPPEVDEEPDYDAWYELPNAEQWDMALNGIRQDESLEISPDNLRAPFEHSKTLLDVFA